MRLIHFLKKIASTPPSRLPQVVYRATHRVTQEYRQRYQAMRQRGELADADFLSALTDSHRAAAGGRPGVELQPFFIASRPRPADFASRFDTWYPEVTRKILQQAEKVLEHRFDLLGSGMVELGPKIDWHRDFKSGYRWEPGKYFKDYERVRLHDSSDIKVTRELSRFQHLPLLGKAYWLTGDERYAREVVTQLTDWMDENPPQFSINWDCAMDVGIRAANWITACGFFRSSPSLSSEFKWRLSKNLLSHGRYLFENLEYYEAPVRGDIRRLNSNHYLSDLAGLLFIAAACPFLKESRAWMNFAGRELMEEIEEQVYPSGVDYEHSVSYHRLVLELFLYPFLLLKEQGVDVPEKAMSRLEKMFEYVLFYTKPDGTHPLSGDADDGRFLIWNDSPISSHRYLLCLGSVLYGRPDMKTAAGGLDESLFWVLGELAVARFLKSGSGRPAALPPLESKGFADAQFFIMRKDVHYCFVDAADIGIRGRGSHDHNDRLSFELYSGHTTFFSDSGAFVYSADPEARNRFRSTSAHNTIRVDHCEQNILGEGAALWTIGNEAKVTVERWESTREMDVLRTSHAGYHRLSDPVTHTREFQFQKQPARWLISDEVSGQAAHELEWYFHLGVGVHIGPLGKPLRESLEEGILLFGHDNDQLLFRLLDGVEAMTAEILEDWISPSYGIKLAATTLRLKVRTTLPLRVRFEIKPRE